MSQQTGPLLAQLSRHLGPIRDHLDAGLVGPLWEETATGTAPGGPSIPYLRCRFMAHLKSAGKFPDYCEVGKQYFDEVYDWHVRHMQPIQMTRTAENQMVIQFMFTQLVLRSEMDETYCGQPYDK
jgi:hypothetical protein